jgi:hypothetical protein
MPNAVPFQQGLIGDYNNATSPGVYVSWDANTSVPTTQSIIFKGLDNTNYRFPLIINSYTLSNTNTPLAVPVSVICSSSYTFAITNNRFIVYQKVGDSYNTIYSHAINTSPFLSSVPKSVIYKQYGGVDYLFFNYASSGSCYIYTYANSTITAHGTIAYDSITGLTGGVYTSSNIGVDGLNFYLTYQGSVYACSYTTDFNLNYLTTGVVINNTNGIISGNTINYITNYDNSKIALTDNKNYVYEFTCNGDYSNGNNTSLWSLNYIYTPINQVWSSILYNHFGIIIATDSANNTVNVIASSNVTVNTILYGFNGVGYSIQSKTSTTQVEGKTTNSVGGIGVGYLQFNGPLCVAEDAEYNIIVGDLNNRFTYIPTALTYVTNVQAPLTEFIDTSGNPADIYYIKQTNDDYTTLFSLPPITGDELLLKSSVLYELNALLRVPVYDEEPLYGYLRQSATLAYGDIVTDPAPQIRITSSTNNGQNSSMFVLSPYSAFNNSLDQAESDPFSAPTYNPNYPNGLFYRFTNEGKIYFFDVYGNPTRIQEYDTILVSYYVKLFTNRQINNALYLALQAINAQPGLNKIYSVSAVPFYYDQALVSGATYYLLRQLAVGLNSRERRLLVQDPDQGSFDAVANIKDTAKMYQEEFGELLKKLPIAQRPIMGTISVPEYAMPGGRSRLFRAFFKGGAS